MKLSFCLPGRRLVRNVRPAGAGQNHHRASHRGKPGRGVHHHQKGARKPGNQLKRRFPVKTSFSKRVRAPEEIPRGHLAGSARCR